MKKEDLDEGKLLAKKSYKWWGSSLPMQEHEMYKDEPIPKLIDWLNKKAFPELEPKKGRKQNARKS